MLFMRKMRKCADFRCANEKIGEYVDMWLNLH